MRIGYVSPGYPPRIGGVETHVAQLASRLAAQGHAVQVLTGGAGPGAPPLEQIDGVTVRRFRLSALAIWSFLARHDADFDLVHAHSYHALPALAAALGTRRPLIFTPHYIGPGHSPLTRALHVLYRPPGAWIFRRSRRIICVSEAEATLVRQRFPSARDRLTVIPNGVAHRSWETARPPDGTGVTVLTAGRLERYKRVDLVIEALAYLDGRFRLRVIGDGPARQGLQSLVSRLHLDRRVELLGPADHGTVLDLLRGAQVFVSMSRQESSGLAVLEALAGGAVVVASDIPAHRELAAATEPGALNLVPCGVTAAELAGAITAAAGCRVAPSALPTWDTVAAETLALYEAALLAPTGTGKPLPAGRDRPAT